MNTFPASARPIPYSAPLLAGCALAAVLLSASAHSQIQFEDVSAAAGIDYVGESWGSAWGDFNGDGRPDIWSSNHGKTASIWLNNGDGTFTNIAAGVLPEEVLNGGVKDEHGSVWGDFDNDGDQDLFQAIAGGSQDQPNRMYINDGGMLINRAVELGLAQPQGRGRTPLWLDQNNDGLLDLMLATATSGGSLLQAPSLNLQKKSGFVNVTEQMQLNLEESTLMILYSDVFAGPEREVLIGAATRSLRVYTTDGLPFQDISNETGFGAARGMVDGIAADLTGNLVPEIYMVEGEFGQDIRQTDPVTLEIHLSPRASEEGVSFNTTGDVTFELYPVFNVNPNTVFIGAGGMHPASGSFTLSPTDPAVQGTPTYTPGVTSGFFISFEPAQNMWRLVLSSQNLIARNVLIQSTDDVSNVLPIGFDLIPSGDPDSVFVRDGAGVYQNEATVRGITEPSFGRSIGVGDFDNDMDLDLYIVATGPVENLPNLLYQNDGAGNFTAVPAAGGAAGGTEGRGDAVTVGDFDEDGFLDLFVTNGKSKPPFEFDGPYYLFRNVSNGNNWLEIDLEGVVSNRDGIGAKIVATSGEVAQVREYGNDIHWRSQNHRRAHFGLGQNSSVEQITIDWPSGLSQVVTDLPANQRVRIVEPASASPIGKPKYAAGFSDGLFIWQDSADGAYRLRASGGENVSFHVRLVSKEPLAGITPVALGRNDRLTVSDYGFDLAMVVNNSENGIDFQLAAGAPTLLSVEREGISNPRLMKVGAGNGVLPPAGWIIPSVALPPLPAFVPGTDMGLHIGKGPGPSELQARWTGDQFSHDGHLLILSDEALVQITPVSLEGNDILVTGPNFVDVDGGVGTGQDGIDLQLDGEALIGISYTHDRLFQSHRVNSGTLPAGLPNAVWLPPVQASATPREKAKPPRTASGRKAARTPGRRAVSER